MSNKKIYIVGAGSVGGHVALNIEEYTKEYTIAGFFDDDPVKIGTRQFGFKVLGRVDEVLYIKNAAVVMGIAFPGIKRTIIEKLSENTSLQYPTLIHKRAWISRGVSCGKGCIIYPGTTINYGSIIDDFVVLNANCTLGHHTSVGIFSSFSPGVNTGGHSTFKSCVEVGIGSCTIQNMEIGAGSVIGGQSMIIKEVKPRSTVVGVPAKELVQKKIIRTLKSKVTSPTNGVPGKQR
jgi:sugar O-acyltransferase (sialic acid O-acetyltransferase NeuD family)